MDIIYSRVSKENEKLQDIDIQEKKIIEKFNLINPRILRERGTAYNISKLKKRTEFLRLINYAFSGKKTTITDIFLGNYTKKEINLYLWDSHRIMRNVEYSLFFLILSDFFDVNIYTYKDGNLKENSKETPSKKLIRYMTFTIHAYSGEEYSYTTSENIKKSFVKKDKISYSNKGNKVGKKFRNRNNEKVSIKHEELIQINEEIKALHKYYKKEGKSIYYDKIIDKIKKKHNIVLSKPYISSLKEKGVKR